MNRFASFAFAVFATLIACVVTWLFQDFLAPLRLLFFWVAVLLTAVIAGFGPALVAIALSVLMALLYLFATAGEVTTVDVLRLGLFTLLAGGISLAAGLQKRAEQRAKLSELRYRTLVEATTVDQAVWTATPDGRIHWSDAWLEITGQTRAEVEGGAAMRVVHPEDAPRTWGRWQTAIGTGKPYEDELRVRVKDGTWRWFAIRAVPVRDGQRVDEWTGIIADIDARKRHQQESEFLNRASELLSSSLEYEKTLRNLARLCVPTLGDWCSIHLATGSAAFERVAVEHTDPAKVQFAEQLDRLTRPSAEKDPVLQVMQSGRPHLVEHVTDDMLAAMMPDKEHLAAVRSLGFRSWIVAPMITGGRVLGTLTVVHGESDRHYSEADLPLIEDLARRAATAIENARLYEEAEAANRTKDEFLATLSHELRTPLTVIAGWSHMLQMGIRDEQTTRLAVETIVRAARTQAELIDDLLDLSRVVAGTLHLNVSTVDLSAIVEDVLSAARPAADAKGLALKMNDDTPVALVRGDERRLRQIVWNLVANAVKFTDGGGSIEVRVWLRGRNARLEVIDTGRGIDASFLPHVWDRFRQGDSSTSRQHGGLGLGLAVVRHLVELHGGTVGVESAGENRGSRFAVEIPLARLDASAASAMRADVRRETPLAGQNVLVVDDDPDSRVVLSAMLRQQGADVTPAESAQTALRAMQNGTFTAIVSDIAMPGEDGFSLAHRVRKTSAIPMIAVSAIATGAADREKAIEHGFDDFLRKPVDPRQLAEVLRAAVSNRNSELS